MRQPATARSKSAPAASAGCIHRLGVVWDASRGPLPCRGAHVEPFRVRPARLADLMYNQTKALKDGKSVEKPIYNHVSGKLDPAEKIDSPQILVPAQLDRPQHSLAQLDLE